MEYQAEQEFIEVRSPIDRFKELWGQQSGPINFLRQCNLVVQNAELLQYAEFARIRGWTQPLMFALQGLVLTAFLMSAMNLWLTRDRGKQIDQIAALHVDLQAEIKRQQEVRDAAQAEITRVEKSKAPGIKLEAGVVLSHEDAIKQHNSIIEDSLKSEQEYKYKSALRERELHATADALALAHSGTPLIFALALLFAAQIFQVAVQKDYRKFNLTKHAGDFYLYFVVGRGLWYVLGMIALLHLALSGVSYGMGGFFENLGPLGAIVFWLGLYALLVYTFYLISQDLYRALHMRAPVQAASPENRLLLHMHNSFWIVFAVFEVALLGLSYGCYLLERSI
ncbi:MAG TPA: hypothetical protein VKZ53_06565 [Candidatus Angelobacter sp.]|nr:hypothetical protein [Candidatus Angelobacter sp.]